MKWDESNRKVWLFAILLMFSVGVLAGCWGWTLNAHEHKSSVIFTQQKKTKKTKQDDRWRKTEKQTWFQNKATRCKVMSRVTYPGIPVFHMAPWLVRSQIWTGRNLAKLLCYGCFLCSTSGFPAKENEKRNSIPAQFHTYEWQPGVKETGYWLKHRMVGILTDELRSGPSERPSNLSKQLLYLYKSKELSVFMLWTIGLNRNNNLQRTMVNVHLCTKR